MSFVRFTRCRNHGDDSDLPVTQEQIEREILPLMEKPDCFIISFTSLKNLYVDNLDKLGLVAYSVPSEERVFMKLGHKLYTVAYNHAIYIYIYLLYVYNIIYNNIYNIHNMYIYIIDFVYYILYIL